jgi:phosphoadenosine phosphosulfate reductase
VLQEITLYGKRDKEKEAIEIIKMFDPKPQKQRVYLQPNSGGKDSLVCWHLSVRAGVEFIPIHAPTIEFQETTRYLKDNVPGLVQQKPKRFDKNRTRNQRFKGKPKTMFSLIVNKGFPPTRKHPFCCSELKENVGEIGDTLIMGIRWGEGSKRKERKVVEYFKGKICIRPIINWSEEEVWEYIHKYNLLYNPLYDMGFNRVGCPGCPKSSNQRKELEMFPQWKRWYLHAFAEMLKELDKKDVRERTWKTPEDVLNFYLGECEKQRALEGQLEIPCEFM